MDTIAIGLPGEAEPVTEATEPAVAKPKSWFRTALYGGAAIIGIGLMGYAFLAQSPQPASQNSVTLPTPQPIPGASTLATPEPPAKPATPPSDAMSELASLQKRDGASPIKNDNVMLDQAPASPPTPQAPVPPPVQEVVVKAPAPPPADPVQTATVLTPAPMTAQMQLDVLGLVREMGVVVRDQRQEIVTLRKTVADLGGKIGEFDQRLSLAEARGAVAAAMGAPAPAPERRAEQKPAPEAAPVMHHYRVQAASPGLAMLSVTDPGPDGAGPVQVQVGEQVPGYGKVKSIAQHGTAWRVVTERGAIE